MNRSGRLKKLSDHTAVLAALMAEVSPEISNKPVHSWQGYYYKNKLIVLHKAKGSTLHIQTPGKTPRDRWRRMKQYMTLAGNVKIKPDQPFPQAELRKIIKQRVADIKRNPKKTSAFGAFGSQTNPNAPRHERTATRIRQIEEKLPIIQKVTKHPRLEPWIVTFVTTIEVAAGLLFLLLVIPWVISLIPDFYIPFPNIHIPLPDIHIPLPQLNINLPDLPQWVKDILYWVKKTFPIWIALAFAIHAQRKKSAKK